MNAKNIGIVLLVVIVAIVIYITTSHDHGAEASVKDATNATECADLSGNWVDTSGSEGCVAAGGEWSEEESCSLDSYCEEVVIDPEEEAKEAPAENTEPVEGQ
jgi:hypothetical protein